MFSDVAQRLTGLADTSKKPRSSLLAPILGKFRTRARA
jgi:hypothetical protein